jgi:eukaryotic-like serine/threonine-protein kinase
VTHEPTPLGAISPEDFRRVRAIFEAALEQAPSARAAFVEKACDGNAVLLAEVRQMLAGAIQSYPLLDRGLQLTVDTLQAGSVFANDFSIVEAIGRGGMGEVYRAHDRRLDRDVALKILPKRFALDADRLARFTREAQVLGALNHPNIAAIHSVEEFDDVRALVLELVEGPTLAERIERGPIAIDEAVPIARQIAGALEAAHEQGIVHRDLKPANVKLRPDGTVKVLDFGLAKITQREVFGSPDVATSPAITSPSMVQRGLVLGSAAYVSPEQARGHDADKRSDIWAFGVVLYEMLSGRRAFQGEEVSDTLASVLRQDIDWSALPASTPAVVRRLIARCLDRDARQRLRDIGEARIVLDDPEGLRPEERPLPRRTLRSRVMSIAATAIVAGVLGAVAAWLLRPSSFPAITRLTLSLPAGTTLFANRSVVAISPDGTQVVYVTPSGLHLRVLSVFDTQVIRGSEGIFNISEPTFSPDGRSIVFHTTADQTLKKIPVSGGAAVTVAHAASPYGLSWRPDGIVFVEPVQATMSDPDPRGSAIMRVSADGGPPETLVRLNDGEVAHGPEILPGGQQLLFTLATGKASDRWDHASIVVQSLTSGERKVLIAGGSDARYVSTGHLVYAIGGSLFAVAFDVELLEVRSAPVSVLEGVRRADASSSGGAHFTVAANGTLAYVAGPRSPGLDLALTDRRGGVQRLNLPPRAYEAPRLSSDGTRLVVGSDDGREVVVWMYALSAQSALRRVTYEGNNRFPIWSRDDAHVAFQSDREGDRGIFWQFADGSGKAERLTRSEPGESHEPEAWSPTADVMLFSIQKGIDVALWMLSVKDRKAIPFDNVRSSTRVGATFSRDGRWVAYASSEGRKKTVYVQPFPPTGIKYQLVAGESEQPNHPLWSPDGTELFYNPGPGEFKSISISTQPFAFGKATPLTRPFGGASTLTRRPYDITPDGKFLVAVADRLSDGGELEADGIRVVLNWTEELKRLVPTR